MKNIEIKNIPEVPSKIKRAVNDKKLAIFIGAGVSRFVGCTSWIEMFFISIFFMQRVFLISKKKGVTLLF
jgi:hypothetical protein